MKKLLDIKFIINLIMRAVGILIGMFVFVAGGILSFTSDIGLLMGIVSLAGAVFALFAALYDSED